MDGYQSSGSSAYSSDIDNSDGETLGARIQEAVTNQFQENLSFVIDQIDLDGQAPIDLEMVRQAFATQGERLWAYGKMVEIHRLMEAQMRRDLGIDRPRPEPRRVGRADVCLRQFRRAPVICDLCGEAGHRVDACPHRHFAMVIDPEMYDSDNESE
jgi:hypothetical protein